MPDRGFRLGQRLRPERRPHFGERRRRAAPVPAPLQDPPQPPRDRRGVIAAGVALEKLPRRSDIVVVPRRRVEAVEQLRHRRAMRRVVRVAEREAPPVARQPVNLTVGVVEVDQLEQDRRALGGPIDALRGLPLELLRALLPIGGRGRFLGVEKCRDSGEIEQEGGDWGAKWSGHRNAVEVSAFIRTERR
ncbi:MAG: hypothetical protein R3F11_01165 [Verrucomicrobiales bacterium]